MATRDRLVRRYLPEADALARSTARRLRGLAKLEDLQQETQAHCNDPETNSSTATSAKANAITRRVGPWFDSYTEAR